MLALLGEPYEANELLGPEVFHILFCAGAQNPVAKRDKVSESFSLFLFPSREMGI